MPQPQAGPPPEPVNLGQGAGGFIVPPLPPGPGGPIPPVVPLGPYPGFVPQSGPQVPVVPGFERSPGVHSPVIPEPPRGWPIGMPEPGQYVGPGGPVRPGGTPYDEYRQMDPTGTGYVGGVPGDEEIAIPSPPSFESGSPLPVPERGGTIVIPPSYTGPNSGSSTPSQQTYQPPPSPGALPIPLSDVPAVVPVAPFAGDPNILVPPPGHIVQPSVGSEPIIVRPGQQDVLAQPGIAVVSSTPSIGPFQPAPIVIHPPVPVPGSQYGPSRAGSRASTRAPVVVVQSPVGIPATVVEPPLDDHVHISPTIRPYSRESRHTRTHRASPSPSRGTRRRGYSDDDQYSRPYSPGRDPPGRYRSPEYDGPRGYPIRYHEDDYSPDPSRRSYRRHNTYGDEPEHGDGRGDGHHPREEEPQEDPGQYSAQRRPSGRSGPRPDTDERDAGDGAPPSRTRSPQGPGVQEGTAPALTYPQPPTIIRLGGPYTRRSLRYILIGSHAELVPQLTQANLISQLRPPYVGTVAPSVLLQWKTRQNGPAVILRLHRQEMAVTLLNARFRVVLHLQLLQKRTARRALSRRRVCQVTLTTLYNEWKR